MKNKLILAFVVIITFYLYPQKDLVDDTTSNVEKERILRSYITVGYGQTLNDKNWAIGVGWFFPLAKNFLIGPRANVNIEKDAFPVKRPAEDIWDIDLVIKYIPFISERFIFSVGGGAGYGIAGKRGGFIRYQLFTAEYEKEYSSFISLLGELEADLLITDNFGVNVVGYTLYADNRTFVNYQLGIFLCKILELH
jgi:hypothetical protein